MKFFHLFLCSIISVGCASQKGAFPLEKLESTRSFAANQCLEDGTCTVKIIPNKALALKEDNFGQLYGETVDSDLVLFIYTYKRNVPDNLADAQYSETYYFSIPKNTRKLDLSDAQLQTVKLVVDRQCYCKGTAGFFKITSGNLKLNIEKNELTLSGKFSNKKLPLAITKIDESLGLEK